MTITERVTAAIRAFRGPFRNPDGTFRLSPASAGATDATPGEIAFADARRLFPGKGNERYAQYNPSALVGQQGLRVFDDMRRDDQVKAALAFKKYTVISTGWTIQSPEGQPADWEPTRFARFVLENLDPDEIGSCTLDGDLYEILGALDYGYSVTEKIWAPIEDGEWAGHIGLRSLKTRAPHGILFSQDEFGNLAPDGIVQVTNRLTTGGRLPRNKFVLFTYQSQFGNPYGTSDLEAAYFPWWIKHNASKWLAMLLEALGIPPIFGLYDPQRYTPAQIDELKKIFQNLQARTFGIIPKPGGTTAQGGASTLDFWSPELAGQASRVFLPALEHLDQRISRAILMPSLIGLTNDTSQGSFARSRVHFDVFLLVVEAIRKDLERIVMEQQIIRPLLDLNFPGLTEYPKWQLFPITDDIRLEILNRWKDLVAGKVVVPQEDDEPHIRQLVKFPEKRPGTPEATGPTAPAAPAPAAAAAS